MQPDRVLQPRRCGAPTPHPRMEYYLRQGGFWEVANFGNFHYDSALISALVERWRPETHTFHLPYGECTVTLQDVAMQLGLRVDGDAVSGNMGAWERWHHQSVWDICFELLGAVPEQRDRHGSYVKLTWLKETFRAELFPIQGSEVEVQRWTRAYLLHLIGGFLMPDKSSSRVHLKWLPLLRDFGATGQYSWGSAVLACLYRGLCRAANAMVVDIGGCSALLLSWAYYRIPSLHPGYDQGLTFPLASRWRGLRLPSDGDARRLVDFRARLDSIPIDGFRWAPYEDASIVAVTPTHIYAGAGVWASVTALICFEIVEWHQPDRVQRQYQCMQPIPHAPLNIDRLHAMDGRGNDKVWWPDKHAEYHGHWMARAQRVVAGTHTGDFLPSAEYLRWYSGMARRYLSTDTDLHDPRLSQVPQDLPADVGPAPFVPRATDAPDRRRWWRRSRTGTRSSQRQGDRDDGDTGGSSGQGAGHGEAGGSGVGDGGDDGGGEGRDAGDGGGGDGHGGDGGGGGGGGGVYVPGGDEGGSYCYTPTMDDLFGGGISQVEFDGLQSFLDAPTPPHLGVASASSSGQRPEMDLNMPSYDLFRDDPLSAVTPAEQVQPHVQISTPSTPYVPIQQLQQEEEDEEEEQQQLAPRRRLARRVQPRHCHSGCELPAPRRDRGGGDA